MEKKKEEKEKTNRFTYESDKGLSIVSKGEKETKEEKAEKQEIKKGFEKWL